MKYNKKYLFVFFLLWFILSCNNKKDNGLVEKSESTENQQKVITELNDKVDCYFSVKSLEGLKVRRIPDLTGEKIGLLKNRQIIHATEKTNGIDIIDDIASNWYYIKYRELQGWVFGGYLEEFIVPEISSEDLNNITYKDFKANYGSLVPTDFSDEWSGFYIFALDKIDYKQEIEILMNDLYVEIDNGTNKIISGLYKNCEEKFGVFIAKVTNDYSKIIESIIGVSGTDEDVLKIIVMRKYENKIYYTNNFGGSFIDSFNIENINSNTEKEKTIEELNAKREFAYNSQNGVYENLLKYLRTKTVLIIQNNESMDYPDMEYKSNKTFAGLTTFYNNELLDDSKIKVGMSTDDVYLLLGKPDRTLDNCMDYRKSMYVKHVYPPYYIFYADTSIEFTFDNNNTITQIGILVEGIEEPKSDDDVFL